MDGKGRNVRAEALQLNLLILLGYRNAVSIDTSLLLRTILEIAADPEQTDGEQYTLEEVQAALAVLLEDERVRLVKEDFDASDLANYATGFHPDHKFYITPIGILSVKQWLDASGSASQSPPED